MIQNYKNVDYSVFGIHQGKKEFPNLLITKAN